MDTSTPIPPSRQALFRFAVLSPVLTRMQLGDRPFEAIEEQAGRMHLDFAGSLRRVSSRSLYRWLAAYQRGGFAALEPRGRASSSSSSWMHLRAPT